VLANDLQENLATYLSTYLALANQRTSAWILERALGASPRLAV
jgi:hypothetical protein